MEEVNNRLRYSLVLQIGFTRNPVDGECRPWPVCTATPAWWCTLGRDAKDRWLERRRTSEVKWTTFVLTPKLKSRSVFLSVCLSACFSVFLTSCCSSEQLLFSCVSSKVIVCHAIYHMSNVIGQLLKLWSLVHAEQLLFSCLGSKVTVYKWKLQCFFWTSSSSSVPMTLQFIELVPS